MINNFLRKNIQIHNPRLARHDQAFPNVGSQEGVYPAGDRVGEC